MWIIFRFHNPSKTFFFIWFILNSSLTKMFNCFHLYFSIYLFFFFILSARQFIDNITELHCKHALHSSKKKNSITFYTKSFNRKHTFIKCFLFLIYSYLKSKEFMLEINYLVKIKYSQIKKKKNWMFEHFFLLLFGYISQIKTLPFFSYDF